MVLAQIPAWLVGGLVAVFLLVSVVLILTVLIQRPMGGGLSGAFGSGAGSGQSAFGAKTGDVLTIVTIVVFSIWLLGAIGLNFATRPPEATVQPQIVPDGPPTTGDPAATAGGAVRQPTDVPAETAAETPGEADPAGEGVEQPGDDAPPPGDPGAGEGEDDDGGGR
jgi:preprotein translocase subunit SecG